MGRAAADPPQEWADSYYSKKEQEECNHQWKENEWQMAKTQKSSGQTRTSW